MPSRPRSSCALCGSELSLLAMLMNSREVLTFAVLSNTRTAPVFCTTYQRASLPGSCSSAIGCVKLGRFGNTRCTARLRLVPGSAPARHVAFAGRASRPEGSPGGGGGGGGLFVGGAFDCVLSPLLQPCRNTSASN